MPRGTGTETLEKKIEKAKEKVCRTKALYDEAVDELQKLLDKQSAIRSRELMKAIAKSDKSYDEIMTFIQN